MIGSSEGQNHLEGLLKHGSGAPPPDSLIQPWGAPENLHFGDAPGAGLGMTTPWEPEPCVTGFSEQLCEVYEICVQYENTEAGMRRAEVMLPTSVAEEPEGTLDWEPEM